jgi:methylmalonyl-CoA mutase cobalamin-binding subunit
MFTKLNYFTAVLAGGVLALSCRLYFAAVGNVEIRTETFEFQQLAEKFQSQINARRPQIQSQLEALNKKSAIADTVGPAVVSDIMALTEKTGNPRLRDLLAKYGVRVAVGGATSGGSAIPATQAPSVLKKGAN